MLKSKQNKNNKIKTLGGRFIKSDDEILFKLTGTDIPNFWDNVTARFTLDGTKATI